MKLLYFGWVRMRIGTAGEEIDRPAGVEDVRALVGWLAGRSPRHAEALSNVGALRVAVNQELTTLDAPVADNDEVALFPPMTGG